MKYIISQSFRNTTEYLVSHAQWPIFKRDIREAKIFDTEQEAKQVFKFWGNKISSLATIKPYENL